MVFINIPEVDAPHEFFADDGKVIGAEETGCLDGKSLFGDG